MFENWDSVLTSKCENLEIISITDLHISHFYRLPRRIRIGCCYQDEGPGRFKKIRDVTFDLVFPVVGNRFVYTTKDKTNSIIFNGSSLEFDFDTFINPPKGVHVSKI